MAKWSLRRAAGGWCFLLLVMRGFGQSYEDSPQIKNATVSLFTTKLNLEAGQISRTETALPTLQEVHIQDAIGGTGNATSAVIGTSNVSRGERMMLVYVRPDSSFETKNVSGLPQVDAFDDVVVKAGEKETIVITDARVPYEDEQSNSEDVLLMEARSLGHTAVRTGEDSATVLRKASIVRGDDRMKYLLGLNGTEYDSNEMAAGGVKMNLASLLAKDYEEINALVNAGADAGVPRGSYDGQQLDVEHAVRQAANSDDLESSGSAPRPVHIAMPPSTFARNGVQRTAQPSQSPRRNSGVQPPLRPRPRAHLVRRTNDRSDTAAPAIVFSPRKPESTGRLPFATGDGAMIFVPAETMERLTRFSPPAVTLPRTAAQRTQPAQRSQLATASRRQQPVQSWTSASPSSPSQFGRRIPRPAQQAFNTSMLPKQQVGVMAPQTYLHSSASALEAASSQTSSVRRLAPHLYYLRQPSQRDMPRRRNQSNTPSAPARSVPKDPSTETEFGARLRPMTRGGAAINMTSKLPVLSKAPMATKGLREAKINQLRSNLVGKLVVIQSMLNDKQAKSEKLTKTTENSKGTIRLDGLLKPIKSLRPPTNPERTESSTPVTTAAGDDSFIADSLEPMFVLKNKKTYRRPPSLRKPANQRPSSKQEIKDDTYTVSASSHQSVVISKPDDLEIPLAEYKNSTSDGKARNISDVGSVGVSSQNITNNGPSLNKDTMEVFALNMTERASGFNIHNDAKSSPENSTVTNKSSQRADTSGNSSLGVSGVETLTKSTAETDTLSTTSSNTSLNHSQKHDASGNATFNSSTWTVTIGTDIGEYDNSTSSTCLNDCASGASETSGTKSASQKLPYGNTTDSSPVWHADAVQKERVDGEDGVIQKIPLVTVVDGREQQSH